MTWKLAPVPQIVQKITKNYCSCSYLSTDQFWWLHKLWFKRYSKMHLVSCTNTYRDVTDLVNHEMVKKKKIWISSERNIVFLRNKKFLICAPDDTFWEVNRFVGCNLYLDSRVKKYFKKYLFCTLTFLKA